MEEEGRADVQLESGEPVRLCEVGVPETDGAGQGDLPREEVVHPAEGELEVVDSVGLEMLVERKVDAADQFF